MKDSFGRTRRDFLKVSAAGFAAAGLAPQQALAKRGGWTNGMAINPSIDNLRVVCCHDSDMVTGNPTNWDMAGQNATVDAAVVGANMDEMAKALADKADIQQAWRTIFQKKDAVEWADVKVAIKVNCLFRNHPRVAIVGKVCRALIDHVGVPAGNIIVYDRHSSASPKYSSFVGNGLPSGIIVSDGDSQLGGSQTVAEGTCAKHLADGTIDILVNIAVNKGHGDEYGGFTLSMKNHFGTFNPNHNTNYLININKSDAILGGNPPRQQLCVLDSLFAMNSGPDGLPDQAPHRLAMGVFGPAFDYIIAKRIRVAVMGDRITSTAANTMTRFATDFGYDESEYEAKDLIAVTPASQVTGQRTVRYAGQVDGRVRVFVGSAAVQPLSAAVEIGGAKKVTRITVADMKGRVVRHLPLPVACGREYATVWDATDHRGRAVSAGSYAVAVETVSGTASAVIRLRR